MHAIEIDAEPSTFEVVFSSGSWLFSTFARCFCAQAALETAEKNFRAHALLHDAYNFEDKPASAYVISGSESRFFARRDGRWQLARDPAAPRSGLSRIGSLLAKRKAPWRAAA